MKKLFAFILIILFFTIGVFANAKSSDIEGRWAEKISERVVMDIIQDKEEDMYNIFITWREDNLAQKDVYRFQAKYVADNVLEYGNGVHIYRFYDKKGKIDDVINYTNGSGRIEIKNHTLVWIDNKDNSETEFIKAKKDFLKDTTHKNRLFSITLPEELRGFYVVDTKKDSISIYDKTSKSKGFGGFTFGIKAYKNPADHATLPGSRKLGELTDKRGNLYDVVLKHPTDVQYDYTNNSVPPDSFKLLYQLGDIINIKGVNGTNYHKAQGTKGSDLYKDVLQKIIKEIENNSDSLTLEKNELSYMYNVLAQGKINSTEILKKVGYTYYDINDDGIDELLIGEIAEGDWKGVIYDIYTMVDRKPQHVVSGGSRDRYYVCNDLFLCNEYSSGAMESGVRVFILLENSTKLYPQVSFKYDAYVNPQKPWFLSYGNDVDKDKWENVLEKKYKERKSTFEKYTRFDFIPLIKLK